VAQRIALEAVKDVLRARGRPQGEELVIRIGEGSTAADRHETRVAVFREDHTQPPFAITSCFGFGFYVLARSRNSA
jgi:hypothetical protein